MQIKPNSPEAAANGQAGAITSTASEPTSWSRESQNLAKDVEDLVKATTSLTGEELARAKARIFKRVAAARQSVEDFGGAVADRTRTAAKATDGYVHERPWQAIGMGAAAGFLLGYLLARRH